MADAKGQGRGRWTTVDMCHLKLFSSTPFHSTLFHRIPVHYFFAAQRLRGRLVCLSPRSQNGQMISQPPLQQDVDVRCRQEHQKHS